MVTKQTPTEDVNAQIEREIDRRLEAELAAKRTALRAEIASRLQRENDRQWYDRVNSRAPIERPLPPEVEARRRAIMAAGAKADAEWMDRVNSRPIEGGLVRGRRASIGPGGEGFEIKRGGT
jgi:hypothetical protein